MGIYFTGNFKTSAAFWQQQTRSRRTFTTQECTMNRPKVHTRYSCTSKEKEKTRSSYYKSMDIKWMHLLGGCVIFQYITILQLLFILTTFIPSDIYSQWHLFPMTFSPIDVYSQWHLFLATFIPKTFIPKNGNKCH